MCRIDQNKKISLGSAVQKLSVLSQQQYNRTYPNKNKFQENVTNKSQQSIKNKPFKRIVKNKSVPAIVQIIEEANKLLMTSKSSHKNHEQSNFSPIPKQKMRQQNHQSNKNTKIITSIHKICLSQIFQSKKIRINNQLVKQIQKNKVMMKNNKRKFNKKTKILSRNQIFIQEIMGKIKDIEYNLSQQKQSQFESQIRKIKKEANYKKQFIEKYNQLTKRQINKLIRYALIKQFDEYFYIIIFTNQFFLAYAKKDRLVQSHGPNKLILNNKIKFHNKEIIYLHLKTQSISKIQLFWKKNYNEKLQANNLILDEQTKEN